MTFDEYIKNPQGSKSSVMSNRQLYQDMYTKKWDELKVRENGLVMYKLYTDHTSYICHLKIPSEVVPKFYYDTVIKFSVPHGKPFIGLEKNLSHYDIQVFSNDPNFVFTFAHAFKKNKMFFDDLAPKMSAKALDTKPVEKNPKDELGYVKSLYFAYLEMKSAELFSKQRWDGPSEVYNPSVWVHTVTHADDKIRDRQIRGTEIERKNRHEKKKKERELTNAQKQALNTTIKSGINHMPISKSVSNAGFKKAMNYENKHSFVNHVNHNMIPKKRGKG